MQDPVLTKSIKILVFFFLLFAGLYYAKDFLIPVVLAGLLAMLLLPISKRIENMGVGRGWAALICLLTLLIMITGLGFILSWQLSELVSDLSELSSQFRRFSFRAKEYISDTFGISHQEQDKMIDESKGKDGQTMSMSSTIFLYLTSLIANFILVLVYIFLFLFFRTHIRNFILRMVSEEKRRKTSMVIEDCRNVAQQYLGGLAMMIVCLWIMYSIGFSIVGVKHTFFFAILCGLLEIVPFVGNLTGTALTIIMTLTQGGGNSMIVGIIVTYGLVQFIQTYFLEPLVVGAEVNINPLSTIMVLVIGEMTWGIPGMILAIPMLGIVKIICDNVDELKPYGYLIGEGKKKKGGFASRLKKWVGK